MWQPLSRQPSYLTTALRKKSTRRKKKNPGESFLLDEPRIEKLDEENVMTASGLEIGHSSIQGYRRTMEDKHIISDFESLSDHSLVAIFDGMSFIYYIPDFFHRVPVDISNYSCLVQRYIIPRDRRYIFFPIHERCMP
jgi:hypothetical protein